MNMAKENDSSGQESSSSQPVADQSVSPPPVPVNEVITLGFGGSDLEADSGTDNATKSK